MSDTLEETYIDWLGNHVTVGDWVLYSSKSTNVGMNLGKVEYFGPPKTDSPRRRHRWMIQIRIFDSSAGLWEPSKLVTLKNTDGAYMSVTKYFGIIPGTQDMAWTS